MLKGRKNSKTQGVVGIGKAISYYTELGYTVCIPIVDNQEYDLIVDIDGVLHKVQVKTTYAQSKYGVYNCNLRVCGGNRSGNTVKHFNNKLVDIVFVLCNDGTCYNIPSGFIKGKTIIFLGEPYSKYKV